MTHPGIGHPGVSPPGLSNAGVSHPGMSHSVGHETGELVVTMALDQGVLLEHGSGHRGAHVVRGTLVAMLFMSPGIDRGDVGKRESPLSSWHN